MGELAVIPVRGVLCNARRPEDWWCWGSSTYQELTCDILRAAHDDGIAAIALHVDSPGGEVAGCAEVADLVYSLRGTKPIVAICDPMACSAAYWIASAADRVTVPQHGVLGNVGAIALHTDVTGMLGKAGVVVTTVSFGAEKADGYPTTPMTDAILARWQAEIDLVGEAFVASVARNRGLKPDAVRGTEAHAFTGAAGVAAGFADDVIAPVDAFAHLLADIRAAA